MSYDSFPMTMIPFPLVHCSCVSRLKVEDFGRDLGCCADRGLETVVSFLDPRTPQKWQHSLQTCSFFFFLGGGLERYEVVACISHP